jgi:hypothetical protein
MNGTPRPATVDRDAFYVLDNTGHISTGPWLDRRTAADSAASLDTRRDADGEGSADHVVIPGTIAHLFVGTEDIDRTPTDDECSYCGEVLNTLDACPARGADNMPCVNWTAKLATA